MSTTAVSAGQVMDRVANLLNDPNKTDYTYAVQIPYLNMAIEEFSEIVSESNHSSSNLASDTYAPPIVIPPGIAIMGAPETTPTIPHYPEDLIEVQELGERRQGETGPFRRLLRKEWTEIFPNTDSLLFWSWEAGNIMFNPGGSTVAMEVQLKYVFQGVRYVANENDLIQFVGGRSYLAYKTASFCARFIGENESRAKVLEDSAEDAIERTVNINNKGKQQIATRHRPFRQSYKMRGWI